MSPPGPKKLALLGATGSIGQQTIEVIRSLQAGGQEIQLVALAAGRQVEKLAQLARQFSPQLVAVAGPREAEAIKPLLPPKTKLVWGEAGLEQAATYPEAELVVNAVVGALGLGATLAALRAGKVVALANKESLVVGGELVLAAQTRPHQLIPLDSEHAALAQLLSGVRREELAQVWITASGGPFFHLPPEALARVTPEQALAHPTWKMGPRITVDSATLVNKAFEVIEAHHLFGLPWEKIGVLVHPQSMVHAIVELVDGSQLAQLASPDMRLPIQAALTHPARRPGPAPRLSLLGKKLEFQELPPDRWPGFWTVLEAGREGGTAPAVANAADEVLVAAFLAEKITLADIPVGLEEILARHRGRHSPTLEELWEADRWARQEARQFVQARQRA